MPSFSSPFFIGGALLFAFAGIVAYFWMSSFLFGAGYQGAPRRSVDAMFRLSQLGSEDVLFELGAGVGSVTFPAAREKSARVRAVEIEPLRCLVLRIRRALGPAADRIEIRRENMFGVDLREATVISAFLWPGAMARLRPKFERELQPGTRIVSRCHKIPTWTPEQYDPTADVYLYRWPDALKEGAPQGSVPPDDGNVAAKSERSEHLEREMPFETVSQSRVPENGENYLHSFGLHAGRALGRSPESLGTAGVLRSEGKSPLEK